MKDQAIIERNDRCAWCRKPIEKGRIARRGAAYHADCYIRAIKPLKCIRNKQMSVDPTMTIHPIFGCLKKIKDRLSSRGFEWIPKSREQAELIERFERCHDLRILDNAVNSIASTSMPEIVEFLRGFLELDPNAYHLNPARGDFAVAAKLLVIFNWIGNTFKPGILADPDNPAIIYKSIERDPWIIRIYRSFRGDGEDAPNEPVFCIPISFGGQGMGQVFVHLPLRPPASDHELLDGILEFQRRRDSEWHRDAYGTLTMPQFLFDQDQDIRWIEGLGVKGGGEIALALQHTKVDVDENGGFVRSGTFMAFSGASGIAIPTEEPERFVIDRPFVFWIERGAIRYPIFAGYIDQHHWKRV